jgi:hypothetical protein
VERYAQKQNGFLCTHHSYDFRYLTYSFSAKFEEYDDLVPLYRELKKMQKYRLSEDHIKQTEKLFLNNLDWNLNVITPNHVATIIIGQGVIFENDRVLRYDEKQEENEDLLKTCNEAI